MRRTLVLTLAAMTAIGLCSFGAVTAAGASSTAKKPPVKLHGKVNDKGTATVKGGAITVVANEYYFDATFLKAKKGETVDVTVKNEGRAPHTFTADDASFDKTINPGDETTVEVTLPSNGKPFTFHCDFHASSGMKGALFSRSGTKASASGTKTSGGSDGSGNGGGYGY